MGASFNGLGMHLGNLSRLSDAETRSLSAENPRGEKGGGGLATEGLAKSCAEGLGRGWKIAPFIDIDPGATFTMADIEGSGAVQHIWMAMFANYRFVILRIYWDDQEQPAVECPVGDFFAAAYNSDKHFATLNSLAVCNNPGFAFNCYWEMPFRKRCRIELENLSDKAVRLYYQVDYTLTKVPEDCAYFHAQFRRVNPLPYKDVYTILDGVRGRGQYVGTYMAWGLNNNGWWGEGEIKFYIDGDLPDGAKVAERGGNAGATICGTGTEDYFCGAWNFENRETHQYEEFCTPYAGVPDIRRPDGVYQSQTRFSLYRWHIPDPIRFKQDLAVTIQALGWRNGGKRYLPLQDDIASVAFWYQTLPTAPFPDLPERDYLEII